MKKGWLRHLDFIVIDICAMELSLMLTQCVYPLLFRGEDAAFWQLYFFTPLLHLSLTVMFCTCNGILERGRLKELASVLRLECLVFCVLCFSAYFLRFMPNLPWRALAVYFMLCIPATWALRCLQKFYLKRRYNKIKYSRQILVVATEAAARDMIRIITASVIRNYRFFGLAIIDRPMVGENIQGVAVCADQDSLIRCVMDQVIDEVVINIPDQSGANLKLARTFLEMGVTVHIYMEEVYRSLPNRSVSNVFGYNVLTTAISSISFRQSLFKRLMDIIGGLAGCILTVFLTLFIGPAVFLKSPGPIFFSQIRAGKRGRPFKIYKFRSMYMDAEQRKAGLMRQNKVPGGMMFKIDHDPRIIKGVGTFIRRASLDEFPQFWNVLKGDMSMVGTRPPTMDEYARYSPHHKRRLTMQPGITGLWQVSGRSRLTDFEEVVRLDTEYIANWSLGLDLKILLKTVRKMIKSDDAF